MATPTLKSILAGEGGVETKYVPEFTEVDRLVKAARVSGHSVVLTQGVYDMFHVGHGRYLEEASRFGDILIVGVDSDELTRQMKGDDRPYDRFAERIELLAMLSFVKLITRRDVGQHMYDLIRLVRPDVLVMSKTTSSFKEKDKRVLGKYCSRIEHLDPKAPPESISTSAKIMRLRREGVKALADDMITSVQGVLNRHLGLPENG